MCNKQKQQVSKQVARLLHLLNLLCIQRHSFCVSTTFDGNSGDGQYARKKCIPADAHSSTGGE